MRNAILVAMAVTVCLYSLGADVFRVTTQPAEPASRPAEAKPKSVVYVCDASGSMLGSKFEFLKAELGKALDVLKPTQAFNIVFFVGKRVMALSEGMLVASPKNKEAARELMSNVTVSANGDPIPSMELALASNPEVIYLVTDGAFDDHRNVVAEIAKLNAAKRTRIHTIALYTPDHPAKAREVDEKVLRRIAEENGGRFKVVFTTEAESKR